MTTLAPNGAMPVGYRKKIAADEGADAPKHAAGVVFVAPDGDILLLRRSNAEANFAGHWAWPGGGVEAGETPLQGASREVREEIGQDLDPSSSRPLDRRITPTGTAFHTFAVPVPKKFAPKLNDEHTGYAWASLNMLPRPLHPAVEDTIRDQIGIAEGASDWEGARDGFMKWAKDGDIAQDEKLVLDLDDEDGQLRKLLAYIKANSEVGHSFGVVVDPDDPELAKKFYIDGDGAFRIRSIGATDSALKLALDRDTVRETRRDGQLYVKRAKITKANICPYRGKEIPGGERLGLDPDRIYQLYRDPEELAKAVPTLNGVQLLKFHNPVNADDHLPNETVGAMGTNAEFADGEVFNDLIIWSREGINLVESNKQKELSAGYHYVPDMTPGEIDGMRFDGRMRDIVFNHVALVEDGRAGDDVVVGDSSEGLMSKVVAMAKRLGSIRVMQAYLKPMLAMDSKLPPMGVIFDGVTGKNFRTMRPKMVERIKSGTKLAQDANLGDVEKVLDLLEKHEINGAGTDEVLPPADQTAMGEAAQQAPEPLLPVDNKPKGFDAEAVKKFCSDRGMSADDVSKLEGMFPKPAGADAEEDDDEEAKKKKAEEDGEKKDDKDMVSKPAMDAALKTHGEEVAKRVAKEVRSTEHGIRKAMTDVRPWIGEIPTSMAFDSAEGVYRHALITLGIDGAKALHADALFPVLKAQPQAGAHAPRIHSTTPRLALDAAQRDSMKEISGIDLSRIGNA